MKRNKEKIRKELEKRSIFVKNTQELLLGAIMLLLEEPKAEL